MDEISAELRSLSRLLCQGEDGMEPHSRVHHNFGQKSTRYVSTVSIGLALEEGVGMSGWCMDNVVCFRERDERERERETERFGRRGRFQCLYM